MSFLFSFFLQENDEFEQMRCETSFAQMLIHATSSIVKIERKVFQVHR